MAGPIVITGGGTGGHIFPMVAIADQLRALGVDDHDLRFVGSRRGQESTLLADQRRRAHLVAGPGLSPFVRAGGVCRRTSAAAAVAWPGRW